MPSVRLSAVRVGVQPAAELRHLQRHGYGLHAPRALLPVPCPHEPAVELSPARCVHRDHPPPSRLPTRIPRPAPGMRSFRLSAVRVGVQPAAELRHLQRHGHALHVLCALRACPAPDLQSSPLLYAACAAVANHLRPPDLHLALHRIPFFRLSAGSVDVQPAAEPRHLQRQKHGRHVLRALLPVPYSQSAVELSPARCVHRGRPPPPASRYSAPLPAPYALLSTLGRAQAPCPLPTSYSYAAHGRATRPSPLLAMARAGVLGPARPHSRLRPPW